MIVTLSESKLSSVIRELEGINDSLEDIADNMVRYSSRLFTHIGRFGVHMQSLISQNGGHGVFRFSLDPIGPVYEVGGDSEQSLRLQGLSMMRVNNLTVEQGDIPGLVPPGITQTVLIDEWDRYAHTLQKILSPSDIPGLLEQAAQTALRAPSSTMFGEPELDNEMFADFVKRSGLRMPGERHQRADEHRRAEEQAYSDLQRARTDAEWNKD